MSVFSERLKELRLKNEYTQNYIAMKLHVGRSTYTHWETDKYIPDYEKLIWLCDFYDVSADYILGRIDEPCLNNPAISSENSIQYNTTTPEKQRLFDYYDRLSEENRDYIRGMMVQLYKEESSNNSDTNAV